MKQISGRILSWVSALAVLVTMVAACGLTIPMAVAADNVLFTENFNATSNGKLPSEWTMNNDYASGTVSVQDGALVLNGIGSDSQTRIYYAGSELSNYGDYMFEADYKILQTNGNIALSSSTRYSSMMYRVSSGLYPYYYCTTRVNKGTNNELSFRKDSSTSSYHQISLTDAPALQVIGQTYHLKVICSGANIKYYIDDTLVFNTTLDKNSSKYEYLSKGSIGFTTSNMKVSFDNIVVTEVIPTVEPQPAFYDTYMLDTDIINPPTVISNVKNQEIYDLLMNDADYAAVSMYYVNKDMNITTPDGSVITSLAAALNYTNGKIIPALFIKDIATADALTEFVKEAALQDAYIVSDDPAVLKYARQKNPALYGVLYTKLKTAATQGVLADLVATTNEAWGKTVMVDAQYLSREDVAYLQKRLMNVWAVIGSDSTVAEGYEMYDNTAKGVNGIVTFDENQLIWILEDCIKNSDGSPIMIREPFMYAHRGYSAVAPQNTMSAFYAAIDNGADLIEMDVRETADGEVVIFHDNYLIGEDYKSGASSTPLTNCTDATKTVENSTLAYLKTLTVTENGKSDKIATLREFLELLRESNGVVGIVEFKNSSRKCVELTAAVIEEMGMQDVVVCIAFDKGQLEYMRQLAPGISCGWLANGSGQSTPSGVVNYAKNWIMSGNLTYHPNLGDIQTYATAAFKEDVFYAAAQRGLNLQPWTFNENRLFESVYLGGVQGLTTDHLEFDDGYVRKLNPGLVYQMQKGVATKLQAVGYTSMDSSLYNCSVLRIGGTDVGFTNNSNGTVTASKTGSANVMLMYKVTTTLGKTYYAISQPAQVKVSDSAVSTATSDHHISLMPTYTGKWQNNTSGQSVKVTRDERGEIFTVESGGWPSARATMNVPINKTDVIEYEVSADANLSIVVHFSNNSSFTFQLHIDAPADSLTSANDLILNGKTISGEIPLSKFSGISDGVSITKIDVYNVGGSVGDEVVIAKFDLVKQVPANVTLVGDVNSTGSVDTADARAIVNSTIGRASMTYKQVRAADVNGDGDINSTDARLLLRDFVK